MGVIGIVGAALVIVGWVWAIVAAFQTSGALWGILNIIPIQPLIGIISAAMKKTAWGPVGLMIAGVIISWFSGGIPMMGR